MAPTEECNEAVWETSQPAEVTGKQPLYILLTRKQELKVYESVFFLLFLFISVILNYGSQQTGNLIHWEEVAKSFLARLLSTHLSYLNTTLWLSMNNNKKKKLKKKTTHVFYDFPQEVIHMRPNCPSHLGNFLSWFDWDRPSEEVE